MTFEQQMRFMRTILIFYDTLLMSMLRHMFYIIILYIISIVLWWLAIRQFGDCYA